MRNKWVLYRKQPLGLFFAQLHCIVSETVYKMQQGGRQMIDMILGGIVVIGLLIYLSYTLMKAEDL
ncbi:K+-transporting ATPase, F subunit (modular protein) [Candidatus Desulfosporosinus infrequens]|uniref:K+-transporting ATPase, F subunit (Modular protein) n=1 Tax=Candidatus Desulfosporosinus infrequens TaxID=2043169 RepID=A0A2U3JYF9_9FIRM|nr:K+-transporting ATPase, F subunit (modular protein) [Candidatus Desulfosporosinus infrequens]